jgi:hypothetical protein
MPPCFVFLATASSYLTIMSLQEVPKNPWRVCMKLVLPSGQALPASVKIVRKELAFLEDAKTGQILPAMLSNDANSGVPGNDEIEAHLHQMGYRDTKDGGFELARTGPKSVPCPSIN